MSNSFPIVVNINYRQKEYTVIEGATVFNLDNFYDVHTVIEAAELKNFVKNDYAQHVQKEVDKKVLELKNEMEQKITAEVVKRKLQLNVDYIAKIERLVSQTKKVLMSEFAISDPYSLEALVGRCLANLDDERPEMIFVSQDNFNKIKAKMPEPAMTLFGSKLPIGMGHGLTSDQVMIEGKSTVVVSDLGSLIDSYLQEVL